MFLTVDPVLRQIPRGVNPIARTQFVPRWEGPAPGFTGGPGPLSLDGSLQRHNYSGSRRASSTSDVWRIGRAWGYCFDRSPLQTLRCLIRYLELQTELD